MFFIFLIFEILPFIIIPSIIIAVIVTRAKQIKKTQSDQDKGFKNTISNANDPNSYANSVSEENLETYCSYCGSKFSRIKKKCPSCGAKVDDIK